MPPTIHPFPELRAYAEREARAVRNALFRDAVCPVPEGRAMAGWTEAHLALLCDLTRPASRDAIARLVAEKVGWQPERVIGAVESSGAIRNRLYRKVGVAGWCSSAPDALSMIVAHLWPSEP